MHKLSEMICFSRGWSCSKLSCRIIDRLSGDDALWRETRVSFLCGQMLDLLHCLLRRNVSRENLPEEDDWEALLEFQFIDALLLSMSEVREKTEFRSKTMRAAKGRINVEKERSKKPETDVIASAMMGDMLNPLVNQGRAYNRYVCAELLKHPTLKSDLVVGLACFDYSVLFTLPRGQAMDVYARLFQSFCVRGWLAQELKNVHMFDHLEFIDDLRFVYLDELHIGPKIEDMVTFLSSSPELSKRENTSYVFKLCCSCSGHIVPELPNASLGSPDQGSTGIDLADAIEPLQSFLLTYSADQKVFVSPDSISSCVEMLAEFGDRALQPFCDPWASVDLHGRLKTHADLTKAYKDVRFATNVGADADVTSSSGSLEKRLPQKMRLVQRPSIDLSKTSKAVAAKTCVSKLHSSCAGTSGEACWCNFYYVECCIFVGFSWCICVWICSRKKKRFERCVRKMPQKVKIENGTRKGLE